VKSINSDKKDLLAAVEVAVEIQRRLPITNKSLALAVLATMLRMRAATEAGSQWTVKDFFTSIDGSYSAVRRIYRELLDAGLLIQAEASSDRRTKQIGLSEKGTNLLKSFSIAEPINTTELQGETK
jgi:predicted transcriptional regulator